MGKGEGGRAIYCEWEGGRQAGRRGSVSSCLLLIPSTVNKLEK